MREIIIASKNSGKIKEYKNAFSSTTYVLKSLLDLNMIEEVEETGKTFKENAFIKAETIYNIYNIPVISDDSGLVVNQLKNLLGVKSKRFSESGTDDDNIDLLLKRMSNTKDRSAYFVTVICFYLNKNDIRFYEGITTGKIIEKRRGHNGFGYDPVFLVDQMNLTYAELNLNEKQLVSHRGKAISQLLEDINNEDFNI